MPRRTNNSLQTATDFDLNPSPVKQPANKKTNNETSGLQPYTFSPQPVKSRKHARRPAMDANARPANPSHSQHPQVPNKSIGSSPYKRWPSANLSYAQYAEIGCIFDPHFGQASSNRIPGYAQTDADVFEAARILMYIYHSEVATLAARSACEAERDVLPQSGLSKAKFMAPYGRNLSGSGAWRGQPDAGEGLREITRLNESPKKSPAREKTNIKMHHGMLATTDMKDRAYFENPVLVATNDSPRSRRPDSRYVDVEGLEDVHSGDATELDSEVEDAGTKLTRNGVPGHVKYPPWTWDYQPCVSQELSSSPLTLPQSTPRPTRMLPTHRCWPKVVGIQLATSSMTALSSIPSRSQSQSGVPVSQTSSDVPSPLKSSISPITSLPSRTGTDVPKLSTTRLGTLSSHRTLPVLHISDPYKGKDTPDLKRWLAEARQSQHHRRSESLELEGFYDKARRHYDLMKSDDEEEYEETDVQVEHDDMEVTLPRIGTDEESKSQPQSVLDSQEVNGIDNADNDTDELEEGEIVDSDVQKGGQDRVESAMTSSALLHSQRGRESRPTPKRSKRNGAHRRLRC